MKQENTSRCLPYFSLISEAFFAVEKGEDHFANPTEPPPLLQTQSAPAIANCKFNNHQLCEDEKKNTASFLGTVFVNHQGDIEKTSLLTVNESKCFIWVFPKIGIPQNGWCIMENPIKMDDLGRTPTIFGNTHKRVSYQHSFQQLVSTPRRFSKTVPKVRSKLPGNSLPFRSTGGTATTMGDIKDVFSQDFYWLFFFKGILMNPDDAWDGTGIFTY